MMRIKVDEIQPSSNQQVEDWSDSQKWEVGVQFLREKFPQKPRARIADHLQHFCKMLYRQDDDFKQLLYRQFVIRSADIPESELMREQRIAWELGHGEVEMNDESIDRRRNQIIADQQHSLDRWITYLASPDARYSDWAKYWAFRSMLHMGKLMKKMDENGREIFKYNKRTKHTVASFPVCNAAALTCTIAALESFLRAKKEGLCLPMPNTSSQLDDAAFQKLIQTENFSKIYTQFLIEMPEYCTEGLKEIRGQWVLYPQGSDAKQLVASLKGYPLEWCIVDEQTVQNYLSGGDMHLYYSLDEEGHPKVPRVVIRVEDDQVVEIRGIAPDQNGDPYIAGIVLQKLNEFPDGPDYYKKVADMKRLTALETRHKAGLKLSTADLRFLYELDDSIEGFGYQRDPRIDVIKKARNIEEDAQIIDVIVTLEKRLVNLPQHYKRPEGVDSEAVKMALEARPDIQKRWALMEITGGRPDLVGETDTEYIFGDCSKESPPGRRNMNWYQANEMAEWLGCELMDEDTYKAIQKKGQFDTISWSWLADDPVMLQESGYALVGRRDGAHVGVRRGRVTVSTKGGGWRGVLKIPK